MRLAERATSPVGRVRREAASVAAELLPALGLDEGRYGPDGVRTGGSPDFEATAAGLSAQARAAVAVLGLVADPAVLPSGLPTAGRAVGKVLLGGVVAAAAAAGTAAAVGIATGDVGRVLTAGITGGAALVGQAAALRADRGHARLAELLRAAADVRRGLPPDALAVHDRAVGDALRRMAGDLADTAAALDDLAAVSGRPAGTGRPAARALLAGRLAGVTPAATAGRRDRTTSGDVRTDQLAVPPVGPEATPARRAWAARGAAGPLAAATVAAVGFAVAVSLGVAIPITAAGGLVAALAAVGLTTVVEHAQARLKAGLEARRTDVEDARRTARAAAEDAARSAAGRALDTRVEAESQQAERTARRLDALLADAAAGRPVSPADLAVDADPATESDGGPLGDQLVPGPRTGPVDPAALTDADRAALTDLARALDDVDAARGRGRATAVVRARQAAAGLGLDAPLDLRTDPDELGWPHRRAALDPALQLRLAGLDELPSAVPAPGWAVTRGLASALLPSATAAVLGVAALGVAPAVGLALGPVALAVSAALAERATALGKERARRPGSLWSSAATDELAAADAERTAAREGATAALAEQQAENRRRADRLEHLDRGRDRRRPRTVVPAPPPTPAAVVEVDDDATPAAAPPAGGRPRYPVAVARALGPAAVVVGGAVAVFAAATDLGPVVLVQPQTWDALGAATVPVVAAAVGAAVAALASVAAAGGEALAGKSGFDRETARARAVEGRRARWTQVERAAGQAALDQAQARTRAELAHARADLTAAREQLDDAVVRSRRPRLLQLVLDRAAEFVATVESALGRLVPGPSGDAVLVEGTSARDLAVLARAAEQLPGTPPEARADRVRAVLDEAGRLGLLDPGPEAARRRTAVPVALAAVSAAFVGSAVSVGQDEQLWRWVRTVANATGWWPEDTCDCPPGAPCTCAPPAPALVPQSPAPVSGVPTQGLPASPPPSPTPSTSVGPSPTSAPSVSPVRPVVPPLPYAARPDQQVPDPQGKGQHGAGPLASAPQGSVAGWPAVDVDDWVAGPGRTTGAVVTVVAPGGSQVDLLVRWVDPGPGHRPVLVLSEVPGASFWWGVPAAVLAAAVLALGTLRPPAARLADAVVVGQRGDGSVLSELPVVLGGEHPELVPGRGPRQLDRSEAGAAIAALRLRPVADLLGRLRRVPAGR